MPPVYGHSWQCLVPPTMTDDEAKRLPVNGCRQYLWGDLGHKCFAPGMRSYSTEISAAWLVMEKVLAGPHADDFAYQLLCAIDCGTAYRQDVVLAALRYLTPKTICELALIAYGVPLPTEEE